MGSRRHRLGDLGSYYHVISRGLDGKPIFQDDRDRHTYLLILADVLRRTGTRCFAMALMRNHVHLVLQVVETALSDVMHRLNLRWALHHNRRHGGAGHVFQGRFRSILIEDEVHLLTELAYVHLNPVRAGVVTDEPALRHYAWTGHAALMGLVRMDFLEVDRVLGWFAPQRTAARHALARFVDGVRRADGVASARSRDGAAPASGARPIARRDAEDLSARNVIGVSGDSDRLDRTMRQRDARAYCRVRLGREGWTLDRLLARVCSLLGTRRSRVIAGGRRRDQSRARALFTFLAVEYLGASRTAAGRMTGVAASAAAAACLRGARVAREDGLSALDVFEAAWMPRDAETQARKRES